MHRLRSHKPSPAMAVAVVALIVALGGTATAAFGPFKGDKIIKKHSLSGNRLKNHAITGSQVNLSLLGTVPNAANANTASNANALGGIAPAGYTHSDCASTTGQIKGFAIVSASATFPATLTGVGGYNCSGQAVQARRISQGIYEVTFLGSPVTVAVGNVNAGTAFVDAVGIKFLGAGDFEVHTYNVQAAALQDHPFALVTP